MTDHFAAAVTPQATFRQSKLFTTCTEHTIMAQAPGVIEVLDAPAAAGHAAGVLARLAEREQQRAAAAARRLEELQVKAEPHESVDRFLEGFAEQRQHLEAALQAATKGGGSGGGSGSGSSGGDAAVLADLAERIAELEKAVADAAYFLPAYDLRQATLALAALRERQEAAAAALQPRKRFAFNRKASKGPTTAADVAAAHAGGVLAEPGAGASSSSGPGGSSGAGCAEQQQQGQGSGAPSAAAAQAAPSAAQAACPGPQRQEQQGAPAAGGPPVAAADAAGDAAEGSSISGLRGQVVALPRDEAAGKEFTLSDLEDCSIFLLAPLAALFLHTLRRCRVYTGPVAGACFVEGAEDCVLMIAARQVRIHAAERSDFYLRVRSHPIIEHSSRLRFAPYDPAYPGSGADLADQGLDPDSGMWCQVNDFGWLRATPSPHWDELPEGERADTPVGPPALAPTECDECSASSCCHSVA